jgi:hypothetical protein
LGLGLSTTDSLLDFPESHSPPIFHQSAWAEGCRILSRFHSQLVHPDLQDRFSLSMSLARSTRLYQKLNILFLDELSASHVRAAADARRFDLSLIVLSFSGL